MPSIVGRILGFVASLAVVMTLSSPASAGRHDPKPPKHPPSSRSVPELDPAGLGALASLLVGGTLLMRSRRHSRPTA